MRRRLSKFQELWKAEMHKVQNFGVGGGGTRHWPYQLKTERLRRCGSELLVLHFTN